jgi:predicted aldo/keto reductase-like oxidoreductase
MFNDNYNVSMGIISSKEIVQEASSMTSIKQISNNEMKYIKDRSIKVWHFEKRGNRVKPVEGKCDPTNPNHIPINKIVRQYP